MFEDIGGRAIAALVVLVAVLLASAPWGLPPIAAFAPSLLVAMLVFLRATRPETALPAWFAFLAGLLNDALIGAPLGFWALVFLLAHATGVAAAGLVAGRRGEAALWRLHALAATGLAWAAWTVASLFHLRLADWRPMLLAAALAVILFPALARLAGRRRPRGRLWATE